MTGSSAAGWADRQVPGGEEVFLDHVGVFTDDLARAGAQLERLGFQVSPINVQTTTRADGALVPSGTSNRLVRLRRGFLEVLAATHPGPLADQLQAALARYCGLHLIALSHADVVAERRRLVEVGFAMQPVVDLRRTAPTATGAGQVHWSILRPQAGVMPEGRVQFVTAHTPDLSWPADTIEHPNAADALTDLLLCVTDPPGVAERYAGYTGRAATPDRNGAYTVHLDRGRLTVVNADQASAMLPELVLPELPAMLAAAVTVRDLRRTAAVLDANQVRPVVTNDHGVCVGPADALGAYLIFQSSATGDRWKTLSAA